jgi:DNA-binding NarL/FixJ family response regulator
MKVMIVDDHILYREGLANMLDNYPDFSVIGEAGTVREAVEKALDLNPDLILMDISLPDGTGLEALKAIISQRPDTKVVMLTIHETEDLLLSAIRNGAVGYLVKSITMAKLVLSLRALERGETALSRTMTTRIVDEYQRVSKTGYRDDKALDLLTVREEEILKMLGKGAGNQEIARQLVISTNTVKVHIHNILKKMNFRNRKEAAQFARRYYLNDPYIEPPMYLH